MSHRVHDLGWARSGGGGHGSPAPRLYPRNVNGVVARGSRVVLRAFASAMSLTRTLVIYFPSLVASVLALTMISGIISPRVCFVAGMTPPFEPTFGRWSSLS